MSPTPPFVDPDKWTVDVNQIVGESVPLATLVGLVALLALVSVLITATIGLLPIVFTLLSQFILAVGSAVVLLYIVARGIQLGESNTREQR